MSSKKKRLICITGPDGSGKTTLIKALRSVFPEFEESTVWDALDHPEIKLFSSKKDIDNYLGLMSANARLMFLAHALKFATDESLNTESETVILNGYFYKYFVSEAARGSDRDLLSCLEKSFPKPDLVIYLDTPLDVTADRKSYYSMYECGGNKVNDRDSFVDFQKQCQVEWCKYLQPEWNRVDGTMSPDQVLSEVIEIIQNQ